MRGVNRSKRVGKGLFRSKRVGEGGIPERRGYLKEEGVFQSERGK